MPCAPGGAQAELARAASDLAARHPAASAPLRLLGELALEAGDSEQAIAHFREACRRDPADGPARERLARLLFSVRRLEEAVAEFRALAADCAGYPTAQTLVLEGAALLRAEQGAAAQARALEAMRRMRGTRCVFSR
jgi:predicted Zn-dependent protease